MSIAEFLQQVSHANFDPATKSVLTHSKPERPAVQLIKYPLSESSASETILGSGVLPRKDSPASNATLVADRPRVEFSISPATTLLLQSDPNEYIGEGRTFNFSAQKVPYEVEQDEPGGIVISMKDGELPWSISFMSPAGEALRVGSYKNAQRAGSQEESRPGFALSGGGRGCSEVDAQFRILTLTRDVQGNLVALDADFSQQCDRAAAVLRGQLRFRATRR